MAGGGRKHDFISGHEKEHNNFSGGCRETKSPYKLLYIVFLLTVVWTSLTWLRFTSVLPMEAIQYESNETVLYNSIQYKVNQLLYLAITIESCII